MTWAAFRLDAPPAIQTPAMPASGTPVTNANGVAVSVYLTPGALSPITALAINGSVIAGLTIAAGVLGGPIRLSAGSSITPTWSGVNPPTWQWLS